MLVKLKKREVGVCFSSVLVVDNKGFDDCVEF